MEQSHDLSAVLDLIIRPAFAVSNGIIQHCNLAARQYLICADTPVDTLLETGSDEYAALTEGSLYLTLQLQGHSFGATVSRMPGFDVFILDRDDDQPQLQALALAAKELRGPLSDLMVAANRLSPEEDHDNAAQQLLQRSLHQMLRLVGNMSDAARYHEQAMSHQQLHDIPALIGEIFEKAAVLAAHANVSLRFTNCPQSVVALADPEKLERAIYNILSNAIKFSEPGSTIAATLACRGNKLYLTVSDSGRGIPNEMLGNVFSRYLRQTGIEESRQGIGLGMLMIRSAASAHGGTVLIEKGSESGTRLTMTIAIRKGIQSSLASPKLRIDYAGGSDHGLIELADVLPPSAFEV